MGKYDHSKRCSAKQKRINVPILKVIHTQESNTIFVHNTNGTILSSTTPAIPAQEG